MSNQYDEPNIYDFGLDFNYALWTEKSTITLVNVPWNNDYRDVVRFDDTAALNAYINRVENIPYHITDVSYIKADQPVRLDIPFNAAVRFNYLRASNPVQPIAGDKVKDYYYFITNVRYVAPNTTEFTIQLDVWQTYGYDVQFGNCYIERGHIGIANENAFQNYGRDYLAVPEGLDVGNEYRIVDTAKETVMTPAPESGYDVLVVSTIDLSAEAGTVTAPQLNTAKGSLFQNLPQGAEFYIFEGAAAFMSFMSAYSNKPWVTQGIISITAIPKASRYFPTWDYQSDSNGTPAPGGSPDRLIHNLKVNWRDSIKEIIEERYRHLLKFLTFPYMAVELTTWSATPIVLKPEAWNNPDAAVLELASLVAPSQRIVFTPRGYNADDPAATDGDDRSEYLDLFTMITNFPTMAIVNNGALSYMASNVHSIAFQNQSADWSQQRALRSNEVGYDQASSAINTATEQARISRNADITQTALNNGFALSNNILGATSSIANGVGSANPGGIAGGLGSAVMSGFATAIQTNQNNANLSLRDATANAQIGAATGQSTYIRDTNKSLADWAARGDYENTIAGINARVQDARLTQPSTSGQMGGEALNLIFDAVELSARFKMIDRSAIRTIGEYWLRYGYAVRQFGRIPDNFQAMTKFTYWKLSETYLTSAPMPETFKQAIRGIFEKGVTVWANPQYIGVIDIADNMPLEGIRL